MEGLAAKAGFDAAAASEIIKSFKSFDSDNSGSIDSKELMKALKALGENPSASDVAKQIQEVDADNSGHIEFPEFLTVINNLRAGKDSSFGRTLEKKGDISMNVLKGEFGTHSFSEEEKTSFTEYIIDVIADDPLCAHIVPTLKPEDMSLFPACKDGILLCTLINDAVPGTIDMRVLNKAKGGKQLNVHQQTENLNLAVNSAKAIGCTVVNMGAKDIQECREHLILGLIWQIIRIGLLSCVNLENHPELYRLLEPGEEIGDLMKLPPDQILLRWLNYHLKAAGDSRRAKNFSGDIKDSHIYTVVMAQICPKECNKNALRENDQMKRAEMVIDNAKKIKARKWVQAKDICEGNPKLNLGFVANLFNLYPGLAPLTEEEKSALDAWLFEGEGTREARAFMLWLNSLGIDPFVQSLFDDLTDGLVLLRCMDAINPGCVDWGKVNEKLPLNRFKKLENCNYALSIGKGDPKFKFSLVGIGGENIVDAGVKSNETLVLALLWQLMRYHVLSILASLGKDVDEEKMIAWANEMVSNHGKSTKMSSLKDTSLSDCKFWIDLVDACFKCVDYDLVEEDESMNAKLVISMVRKCGGTIFCVPEDLTEVKPKMLLTLLGTIMALSMGTTPATPRKNTAR